MATQKQREKLQDALSIDWITQSQYEKAMSNTTYCYELVGEIVQRARKELIFVGYNDVRTGLASEAIKYM